MSSSMRNEEAAEVAAIILIVLDIVTVAGRFYSRWITKAGWKWDDWTILIALLTGILPGALTIWGAFYLLQCLSLPPTHPVGSDSIPHPSTYILGIKKAG